MRFGIFCLVGLAASFAGLARAAAPQPPPAQVMIVGLFHLSNPGHDYHDVHVDDVLAPKRQAELARIAAGLNRFRPTLIAVEQDPGTMEAPYAKYLAGTLKPSRNEVVQLGFRLAKLAGDRPVVGIDADGDFPYEAVETYAKAHGQEGLLKTANDDMQSEVDRETRLILAKGLPAALREVNDPARLKDDNAFYRTTLKVGGGAEQPGADLLTAWYHRNFLICAHLVQLAKPGARIVVFYGSGHAFLLRQCVRETPGLSLVEANDYLPK